MFHKVIEGWRTSPYLAKLEADRQAQHSGYASDNSSALMAPRNGKLTAGNASLICSFTILLMASLTINGKLNSISMKSSDND
jgi:hypothetical protein